MIPESPASNPVLKPYDTKVAGHDNILSVEDSVLLVKSTNKTEITFYEQSYQHSEFCDFLPTFYGTLQQQDSIPSKIPNSLNAQHICFENVVKEFVKPSIIDIKIGTRLYDDFANEAKVAKMTRKANETTSSTLGVRICGLQVYRKGVNDSASKLKINPSVDLQPQPSCNSSSGSTLTAAKTTANTGNSTNLDELYELIKHENEYCRRLNQTTLVNELSYFFGPIADNPTCKAYRTYLLNSIIDELENYHQVISTLEFRLYSSSLLIVYESDLDTILKLNKNNAFFLDSSIGATSELRESDVANNIETIVRAKNQSADTKSNNAAIFSSFPTKETPHLKKNPVPNTRNEPEKLRAKPFSHNSHNNSDSGSDSDTSSSLSGEEGSSSELYDFRAIDFAHSLWTPGSGPDDQYIFGVRKLIDIMLSLS